MLVVHQLALAGALAALLGAGARAGAALGARGRWQALTAAALAAGGAGCSALALGLVGAGGSAVALLAVAAALWLAAHRLPEVRTTLRSRLAVRWGELPLSGRIVAGLAGGVAGAWTLWLLHNPAPDVDTVSYHLPIALAWVHGGRPGSLAPVAYDFPVDAYPLTGELLLAWGSALGRSLLWAGLFTPLLVALLLLAGWSGLRALEVPRRAAGLAVLAVAGLPAVLAGLHSAGTDLPALTWLVVCAALVAGARHTPGLLVPAVVAAGLSLGTKTTAAPALLVLAVLALRGRPAGQLAALRRPLAAGALAGLTLCAVWYVRNLLLHGSPLWPFTPAPGGDPRPPALQRIAVAFASDPGATLRGRWGAYAGALSGGAVLALGGVLAPLVGRSRAVVGAATATGGLVVAWALAPFTGRSGDPLLDLSLTTVRYLLPALVAGALALALAARRPGRAGRAAEIVLAGALSWDVIHALRLPFPGTPGAGTLVAGALGVAALAVLTPGRVLRLGARLRWAPALALAVAAVALGPLAAGWLDREAGTVGGPDSALVAWLEHRADFRDRDGVVVAEAPVERALLSGTRLQHPLTLIGRHETCAVIAARARRQWVIVQHLAFAALLAPFSAAGCDLGRPPAYRGGGYEVWAPVT